MYFCVTWPAKYGHTVGADTFYDPVSVRITNRVWLYTITDMGYPMSGHNTILCRYLSTDSRPSVGRPLAHSNPCRTSDSCSIWSLRPVVSELHLRDILRGHAATGRKRRENKKRGSPTGLIAASLQVISLLALLAACSHALENQASVVWCVINEF